MAVSNGMRIAQIGSGGGGPNERMADYRPYRHDDSTDTGSVGIGSAITNRKLSNTTPRRRHDHRHYHHSRLLVQEWCYGSPRGLYKSGS